MNTDLTDSQKLSGDIGQYLFDEFCQAISLRFGGEPYELVGTDELGLPDDPWGDPIVRRKSDGKLFEVELEANVSEFRPPKRSDPAQ
jgi:hypothetical protein